MAPDKQPAVDPKTLSSVTQMLTTPDSDRVMQGIELVRSLDDEALCEALLEGMVYKPGDGEENGRLVPNETFSGDEEEQPCLNLALLGLINHGVGVTCTQLRETVTTLATDCPTTAVLSNFSALERLALGTEDEPILELSEFGNLPQLTHLEFRGSDEAVEVMKDGLSSCPALRWLCINGMVFEAETPPDDGTSLLSNREVVLEAVMKQDGSALQHADDSLKADREVVLEVMMYNWEVLLYWADDSLRADREFVLEAVKHDGDALAWADGSFKADREIVLEAVKIFGYALEFADDSLKADREVVLEAVKQNGYALEYVDHSLRADREIVLEAVKHDGKVLECADDSLRADREFVLEAVKKDGNALQFASEELQSDPELKKIAEG